MEGDPTQEQIDWSRRVLGWLKHARRRSLDGNKPRMIEQMSIWYYLRLIVIVPQKPQPC